MALLIETLLTCDNCGATFGEDNKNRTGMAQRKEAEKYNWIYSMVKDFCPNCRHRRMDGQYPKRPEHKGTRAQVCDATTAQ